MTLRDRLAAQVRAAGPMSVAQYMTACLHDPQEGYYATRPALGEAGDFITAPLVSQMFGELIGLWAVECWSRLGEPERIRVVEIGPGDGTLMSDMLRAARVAPEFLAAADVWLVEVSSPLVARQKERLGSAVRWAGSLDDVPAGAPILVIANELLDCLPALQFVHTGRGWVERRVGLDATGALAFGLGGPMPRPLPGAVDEAAPGSVLELSPAQEALGSELARRVVRDGGAALLIDYGRDTPGFGDTLQALFRHTKVEPLECPGEADLTVHADFPSVLAAARVEGAGVGVMTQGEFLWRLGIETRAASLGRSRPQEAAKIARQLARLTDPDQMGELFKAAVIHSPGWLAPGFEDAA
jgi:SAM-dependent MidA family methyltransferase